MKLNKRYSRSIKSNLSFYISTTILTIMTLVLFFTMNMAGKAIWKFGDEFFASQNLEDANFTTYLPISREELVQLEETYDVVLETQYYSNIEADGVTARVFKKPEKINLYKVTEGTDALLDNQVIISEGYAVFNEISIGDFIKIGKKEYEVTGFFQRPDYLYMLQNEGDAYKNVTTFFLAYMTDEAFDELGSRNYQYLVQYKEENSETLRKVINEKYYMRTYSDAQDNMRIDMVKMQAELFVSMSYIILTIMPLVVVVLVSIVINRKVKSEQKLLGTLTALGYQKGRLIMHYAGFAMIPGLLGGILSVIISVIFAQPFGELCLADYEPMRIECHMPVLPAILGVVVPTLMYVLAAIRAVNRLLKKDTVLLLNGNSEQGEKNYRNILVKKQVSFRFKYAMRSLIGNPGRTFVVFLGIFLGSFIALIGFCFLDTMDNTKQNMINEMGSYEYQYVLNELVTGNEYGGEAVLMSTLESGSGKRFSVIGTEDENPYLSLKGMDGKNVSLEGGYYVTAVMAYLHDLQEGDVLTIRNPLTMEAFEVEVTGILDNDVQNAVFCSKADVAEFMGIDARCGNVIMSDVALEIPQEKVIQVIKKSDAKEQFQNIANQTNVMVYFLIGMGCIICVAAIYVAVNMLVSENRGNISMLKVLGYQDKQINQIVLRINHILLPIGFLASVWPVFATINWAMVWLADYIGMLPKAHVSPKSFLFTAGLVLISYFGSLLMLRRKVSKVDMVESLKGNRE